MDSSSLDGFPDAARTYLSGCLAGSASPSVRQLISEALAKTRGCKMAGSALTTQQLHQLARQISILRCIQQRLAVANLLQGDAALVSELAQDAARHGPLALLHLPIAKYKLSSELEGRQAKKRRRNIKQNELAEEDIWSSDVDEEPVTVDVTPETVEMSDEATALVPLQPLAPPRFRRSPIPVTAHKGRGHGSGLENATQNTSTQEGQAGTMQVQKRRPGRPRKGCEPNGQRRRATPHKLDFALPNPLKKQQPPHKTPPRSLGRPMQCTTGADQLVECLSDDSAGKQAGRGGLMNSHKKPKSGAFQKQRKSQQQDSAAPKPPKSAGPIASAAPDLDTPKAIKHRLSLPGARLPLQKSKAGAVQDARGLEERQAGADSSARQGLVIPHKHGRKEASVCRQSLSLQALKAISGQRVRILDLRQQQLISKKQKGRPSKAGMSLTTSAAITQGSASDESEYASDTSNKRSELDLHDDDSASSDDSTSSGAGSESEASDGDMDAIHENFKRGKSPCKQKSSTHRQQPKGIQPKPVKQKAGKERRQESIKAAAPKPAPKKTPPRLLLLKPVPIPAVPEEENFCGVCGDEDGDDSENEVLLCEGPGCQVAVHQQCYGITSLPSGKWLCDGCASGILPKSSACVLCPCSGGALRTVSELGTVQAPAQPPAASALLSTALEENSPSKKQQAKSNCKSSYDGLWAHSACVLWTPGAEFSDPERLADVDLSLLTQRQIDRTCSLCAQGGGAVVQCSFENCSDAFHPLCARSHGFVLPIADSATCLAFCGLHSHDKYTAARDRMIAEMP